MFEHELQPPLPTSAVATDSPVLSFSGGGVLARMDKWVTKLRGKVLVEGAGHWVQAERPAPVNEALLGFLKTVS